MTASVLTAVSAFAGIGGFELGFGRAGIRTSCQIEWDNHCQTILRRHFGLNLHGDISDVRGDQVGRVDLAVGGLGQRSWSSRSRPRSARPAA